MEGGGGGGIPYRHTWNWAQNKLQNVHPVKGVLVAETKGEREDPPGLLTSEKVPVSLFRSVDFPTEGNPA